MSITKDIKVDKIEITGKFKIVQVRLATIINDDGEELSRSFYRYVINPGDDISSEPADIQNICKTVHTQEIIDEYNNYLASQSDINN